jgi:hypothetical protein
MAAWPWFEATDGRLGGPEGGFRPWIERYSQGLGSMITEPTTGWAKNALQDFETLYIGGAEPASFAGPCQA